MSMTASSKPYSRQKDDGARACNKRWTDESPVCGSSVLRRYLFAIAAGYRRLSAGSDVGSIWRRIARLRRCHRLFWIGRRFGLNRTDRVFWTHGIWIAGVARLLGRLRVGHIDVAR